MLDSMGAYDSGLFSNKSAVDLRRTPIPSMKLFDQKICAFKINNQPIESFVRAIKSGSTIFSAVLPFRKTPTFVLWTTWNIRL